MTILTAILAALRSPIGFWGLIGLAALAAGWWHGREQYRAGYADHQTEMARAAAKAEKDRRDDDAHLQNLSDYDLCVEYLGARGVPVVGCDRLRGVRP